MKKLNEYIKESLINYKNAYSDMSMFEATIAAANNDKIIKLLNTNVKSGKTADKEKHNLIEEYFNIIQNLIEKNNIKLPNKYKDVVDLLITMEDTIFATKTINFNYTHFDSLDAWENTCDKYNTGNGDEHYYEKWANNAYSSLFEEKLLDKNEEITIGEYNKKHKTKFKYTIKDVLFKLGVLTYAEKANEAYSLAYDRATDYFGDDEYDEYDE